MTADWWYPGLITLISLRLKLLSRRIRSPAIEQALSEESDGVDAAKKKRTGGAMRQGRDQPFIFLDPPRIVSAVTLSTRVPFVPR